MTGEFKAGKKHGKIVQVSPDGEKYECEYENDVAHGLFKKTRPDGYVQKGRFTKGVVDGKLMTSDPNEDKISYQLWDEGEFDRSIDESEYEADSDDEDEE